jgi:hypothetical protein
MENVKAALKWWEEDAQYLTTGEYGDHNVFDDDPTWVIEARKLIAKASPNNCEYFEIIDWNENTQEIYHAVCTTSSTNWPNCGSCEDKVECAGGKELLSNKQTKLTQGDVDILDGSLARKVRCNVDEDVRVKYLYKIWKSL